MNSQLNAALAAEQIRDRHRRARGRRLAALARCCRQSISARLGRLVTGVTAFAPTRPRSPHSPTPCCA